MGMTSALPKSKQRSQPDVPKIGKKWQLSRSQKAMRHRFLFGRAVAQRVLQRKFE
jgi:hypothetical protein